MSEISEERVEALASNILECHDVKPSEIKALAGLALLALRERAEPVVVPDLHKVVYHFRDLNEGFPVEPFKADYVIAWMLANYPPAPPVPVVPGWIACSERMPKIGDEIFYCCGDDGIRDCGIVGSSNFTGRGDPELFVHSEGFDLHLGADITHWMPLPEAPGKN
ncbi:DUF551 domain-containing protein [Cronobacter sakazakii]|uniref:DUF551 domain-containing protein n=1 Tax=Cronobacter sakazakii TaxID=28141 RepID=UPI000BE7F62C|nr:DUF551 domain-containing protein [Cronobacter sakazakii]EGT5653487.1 DUF551 domain-containing protein [Cronobacter sakazakii]EGT5750922.1 DUF551 domain-containing protein [Cronobacter sakazakii]ELY2489379.1 DUF551 domain-containing protein [Cronobacter sakazakii]ELY2562265.1 DUF551 domain-containing protein [Cronobacter sakazakii]ELY2721428.1 DUF551 domain-containing protein [Cronobacter sakazakii]